MQLTSLCHWQVHAPDQVSKAMTGPLRLSGCELQGGDCYPRLVAHLRTDCPRAREKQVSTRGAFQTPVSLYPTVTRHIAAEYIDQHDNRRIAV